MIDLISSNIFPSSSSAKTSTQRPSTRAQGTK
jgi:hypothetical protein